MNKLIAPPYYVLIFTPIRTLVDDGYDDMSKKMLAPVEEQAGNLGSESGRDTVGITVSYCRDSDSIRRWKEKSEHVFARHMGRKKWYESFKIRIAMVESEYGFRCKENESTFRTNYLQNQTSRK